MNQEFRDIPMPDGAMNTFLVWPDGSDRYPVVLFYMDAFGLREELYDMARRMASWGYLVVLPNLFYRKTREFQVDAGEEGLTQMRAMMGHLDNSLVARDTLAMLSFVDDHPAAHAQRIGAVGYCMSGPFVICAAADHPDRFRCIAAIHGANLVTDRLDSAHLAAARVRSEAYVACAENDKWAAPAEMAVLEKQLQDSGARFQLEWYAGASHGFVFPSRVGSYHQAAAERHWQRLRGLFERCLRS